MKFEIGERVKMRIGAKEHGVIVDRQFFPSGTMYYVRLDGDEKTRPFHEGDLERE